jgi:cysteine desulfurase/selenocysteine lyase
MLEVFRAWRSARLQLHDSKSDGDINKILICSTNYGNDLAVTRLCAASSAPGHRLLMTIDIEKVRQDFPYLSEVLYLNTASAGLAHARWGQAAAAFYERMLSRGYDGREDWRAVAGRVQALVARLMQVEPDEVGFTGSTTEALNLTAQALPAGAGDRVVFLEDEFPSLRAALAPLAAKGAEIRTPACTDEARRTDVLCEAIEGAKIVGVSHVHWCTGTRIDLPRLAARCRAEGATLLVDGIQALGATAVDATHVDIYAASCFKWLLAGFGIGVVVIRKPAREKLNPFFRGYFNPPPSTDIRYGHINHPGLCVLEASLTYMASLGWDDICRRVAMLRGRLAGSLIASGFEIVTPQIEAAGILSFKASGAEALVPQLHARGVRVEARGGLVRVSPHFYNTESEIDRFVETLMTIRRGAKQ